MKAKNLNSSSSRTRNLIRKTFAEMLYEKREISKITVTELVNRAGINRGTFYTHYNDIYAVAEDYENDLTEKFFDNAKLLTTTSFKQFMDSVFAYFQENDEVYKMMCVSNETFTFASRLITLTEDRLLEICYFSKEIVNRRNMDLEINIMIQGLMCEYYKYCRGYTSISLKDLKDYIEDWYDDFLRRRTGRT
ncbi:MAG: TetR/AcrR family transcriptional regulator [Clostridia bacterium]|nr:TetR/AcrR family transcriptional regulator [Clostridia bacterium]